MVPPPLLFAFAPALPSRSIRIQKFRMRHACGGGVMRLPESKCICRFVFYFSLRLWGLVRLILARLIKEYEMDRQQDTAVLPPIGIFAS